MSLTASVTSEPVGVFCTIMSMFAPASATVVNTAAALPGTSGIPITVIFACDLSVATPETIDSSICFTPSSLEITLVPGSLLKVDRTLRSTLCLRANSTARICRIFAPAAASSSIDSMSITSNF